MFDGREVGRYDDWCRSLFESLAPGGTWTVPRSGLIFRKQGNDTLVLVEQMPWTDELGEWAERGKDVPPTPDELRAFQDADFEAVQQHFGHVGIHVQRKPTYGLGEKAVDKA